MSHPDTTSYDTLPYDSFPFPETHPARLGAIATLFGMAPAGSAKCRVLEIGCASGGNLLPLALESPASEFVGIDLSPRQIEDGRSRLNALGVSNLRLEAGDIMELDDRYGQFDYIIAHGVFSWVPPPVQDKLLDLCGQLLRPDGIAYVSYNTYPGWHFLTIVRDAMLFHTEQLAAPADKIAQARAMIEFLAESVRTAESAYGIVLQSELELLGQSRDSYIFHEYLEANNQPIYFRDFDRRARDHGLQYLGDASLATMFAGEFPPKVRETLQRLAHDIVRAEQYLDFLRNRTFRQSLLCRGNVPLVRALKPDRVKNLYLAAQVESPADADLGSDRPASFRTAAGKNAQTANRLTKAALYHLGRIWPANVQFQELVMTAEELVQPAGSVSTAADRQQRADVLAADLVMLASTGLVELRTGSLQLAGQVSKRPAATLLAREMAKHGSSVVNQKHEHIVLDDLSRQLLQLLDGTRTTAELVEALVQLSLQQKLMVQPQAGAVQSPEQFRQFMTSLLPDSLNRLAASALLVG